MSCETITRLSLIELLAATDESLQIDKEWVFTLRLEWVCLEILTEIGGKKKLIFFSLGTRAFGLQGQWGSGSQGLGRVCAALTVPEPFCEAGKCLLSTTIKELKHNVESQKSLARDGRKSCF